MEAKRESHQNLRHLLQLKEEDHHHHHQNADTRSYANSAGNSTSGGGRGLTLLAILSDGKQTPSCRRDLVPSTVHHHRQVVSNDVVLSTERIPQQQQQQQPPISRVPSNRTLLDILREEQTSFTDSPLGGSHHHGNTRDQSSRIRWSLLKNIVRLHHQRRSTNNNINHDVVGEEEAAAASHVSISNNPNAAAVDGTRVEGPAAARMSLMALLEENDRQMGLDGSSTYGSFGHVTMIHSDEEGEEEEDGEIINGESDGSSSKYFNNSNNNSCCVCMVRHKGAAFIPCGHTFCRLCSRELWVQRGNCPLCNNYILEILDIF